MVLSGWSVGRGVMWCLYLMDAEFMLVMKNILEMDGGHGGTIM